MSSSNKRVPIVDAPGYYYTFDPPPKDWNGFLSSFPGATVFQSPIIKQIWTNVPGYQSECLALLHEDEIVGLVVYTIIREKGWKGAFSQRCIIMGGPLVKDLQSDWFRMLLRVFLSLPDVQKAIYIEIRNTWPTIPDTKLLTPFDFHFYDHLNILIDLSAAETQLAKQLHPKRAANIRRARKKGVLVKEIESESEWKTGYQIIKKTYQRVNLPCPPPGLFLNLWKSGGQRAKGFGAFLNNRMIAVRFYLFSGQIIYDWYAGSDSRYHSYLPNDILPWEVMKWAKKKGFQIYDFGGAGRPGIPYGVRTYKERFGGKTVAPGRFIKVNRPFLYFLGKWGIRLYKLFRYV